MKFYNINALVLALFLSDADALRLTADNPGPPPVEALAQKHHSSLKKQMNLQDKLKIEQEVIQRIKSKQMSLQQKEDKAEAIVTKLQKKINPRETESVESFTSGKWKPENIKKAVKEQNKDVKMVKSTRAANDFTSNQWHEDSLKDQVKNQKDEINELKNNIKHNEDTYKFVADKWTPATMQKKVDKERKTISAFRKAEGNAEAEKRINAITEKTTKVLDKAVSEAKTEPEESVKSVEKVEKEVLKQDNSKALYDKVVKNAIAKAKKDNKVISAVKKVEKKAIVRKAEKEVKSEAKVEVDKEQKKVKVEKEKAKVEKESKDAEFKEAKEKGKEQAKAAKKDKKEISEIATPTKAKENEEQSAPSSSAQANSVNLIAKNDPGNLHQKKKKTSKIKNLAVTNDKKTAVDSGHPTKMFKSKPKVIQPKAQTDKYSIIDQEIESEMNEHKVDSLKEGEYYDKAYAKDHDSQLDGESLTQEIGGKSLSSEIKDGIKDISEFL